MILFEDDHLLVVNKPPGWNTHAPSPWAGEGIYDWLRNREPRWASLAIVQRLDKETSGVLVFGKTPLANRSLTEQFASRQVHKTYVLLAPRAPARSPLRVVSTLARAGDHYVSRNSSHPAGQAVTRFQTLGPGPGETVLVQAEPETGRTHQIRVHAAANGFPIIGDPLYGGSPASRLCLHARTLSFRHPHTQTVLRFEAPQADWNWGAAQFRAAFLNTADTDAFRLIHGAADDPHRRGWYFDCLGSYGLWLGEDDPDSDDLTRACGWQGLGLRGVYLKSHRKNLRAASSHAASPRLLAGDPAPLRFLVRENGRAYALSFDEGYSVGLFLDQRDNRRRLLRNHVAAGFPLFAADRSPPEVLNLFAYTCGFSVCAAVAGARVTSVDVSRKYLDWGRLNFSHNNLSAESHAFLCGDVFDWLRRLARHQRRFEVILADPPTFSTSKRGGVWRAEQDLQRLVKATLPLLKPDGVLFLSTNTARLGPEEFLDRITGTLAQCHRKPTQQHYAPQPPDFPICRAEPAHLKSVWLRLP